MALALTALAIVAAGMWFGYNLCDLVHLAATGHSVDDETEE